jgi:hypothetical protein
MISLLPISSSLARMADRRGWQYKFNFDLSHLKASKNFVEGLATGEVGVKRLC